MITGPESALNSNHGLIIRFLMGFFIPILTWLFVVLLPLFLTAMGPIRWFLFLPGILVLARMGFLPGKFHFFKRHAADCEYGITPPICRACGYDLRASPEHCPECGVPVNRVDAIIVRYLMSLRRRDVIDATMAQKGSESGPRQFASPHPRAVSGSLG